MEKKKVKYCYIRISNDQYELITDIADTAEELAKICNTSKDVIYSSVTRSKHGYLTKKGTPKYYPYRKVEIIEGS